MADAPVFFKGIVYKILVNFCILGCIVHNFCELLHLKCAMPSVLGDCSISSARCTENLGMGAYSSALCANIPGITAFCIEK